MHLHQAPLHPTLEPHFFDDVVSGPGAGGPARGATHALPTDSVGEKLADLGSQRRSPDGLHAGAGLQQKVGVALLLPGNRPKPTGPGASSTTRLLEEE
jgi:hypothetical protein